MLAIVTGPSRVVFVYVIAWTQEQLRINFKRISKFSQNLKDFEYTNEINL